MLIAIDVDDVLADFAAAFNRFHFEKYNHSFSPDEFHSEKWWKKIYKDQEEALSKIQEFIESSHLDQVSPVEGAVRAVKKLKKDHDLVVVTARPKAIMDRTREWLSTHFEDAFGAIYSTDFHVYSASTLTKGGICKDIKADILIDDFLDFAHECEGIDTRVLVFDRPWNQKELPSDMIRVKNWEEILSEINKK